MTAAHVAGIAVFPVKGLRGLSLQTVEIERCGPAGDRRWLITDADHRFVTQRDVPELARFSATPDENGLLLQVDADLCPVAFPGIEAPVEEVMVWHHRVRARLADGPVHAWLSARLGRACLLWFMHDTTARPIHPDPALAEQTVSFADEWPLLAVNSASLDALNHALGETSVPIDRFRANLVIEGLPAWDENRWRTVRIGALRFQAPAPCARCVVITRDQQTGLAPQPGEPLKTLARLNKLPEANVGPGAGVVFGINLVPDAAGRLSVGDPVEVEAWAT